MSLYILLSISEIRMINNLHIDTEIALRNVYCMANASKGGCDEDIKKRLEQTKGQLSRLRKMWNSSIVSIKTNIKQRDTLWINIWARATTVAKDRDKWMQYIMVLCDTGCENDR
jgi:hypothetical protein